MGIKSYRFNKPRTRRWHSLEGNSCDYKQVLTEDYTLLSSGRGAIVALGGVRRFRIPVFDSDIRVLLRLRGARAGQVQERSRELGQGMAGFAKGPITDQGKAIAFVHEVGRHMGLSAADIRQLVSRIEFGTRRSSSFDEARC